MKIRYDRVKKAQELMVKHGMIGIMIMNYDDYQYFFDTVRVQPRAIIPVSGDPIFICFKSEEPELKSLLDNDNQSFKLATHVGEQISNVREVFHSLFSGLPPGMTPPINGKPKVGMQLWFHTPAFLVDLFRKVNSLVELVSSDPVMDELRMVKDKDEIDKMSKAQSIAAIGMNKVKELIEPGITGHEIATEVLYEMMKVGASGTSTPIHINSGIRSCWVHGKVDNNPINEGDLIVVDLTPQFDGYCANLARTFILGEPSDLQKKLLETYTEIHEETKNALKPETTVAKLDNIGLEICKKYGLEEYHLKGISHGLGLRFEETPASTIIPTHRRIPLKENMTVTVGHTILAIPGKGGVRFEDVYRVTENGGEILHDYPLNWLV